MRAMVLERPRAPLVARDIPDPAPGPGQLLLRVRACAVCRTDLHVIDGDLHDPKLPLVLGHEIVGAVAARGANATRFEIGTRVGVPWLGWTCGECIYCRSNR
ncbi:MAG TPA: alcohol dehydrogenase catalytic domain-containing protein, partial [Gemmatimonadaceae bacterium]